MTASKFLRTSVIRSRSRGRSKDHGLIEHIVDATHALETGARHELAESLRRDCIIARREHVRAPLLRRQVFFLDAEREAIAIAFEIPRLRQLATLVEAHAPPVRLDDRALVRLVLVIAHG